MRCPRCTLAELPAATETCWLCGYSSAVATAVEDPPPPPTPTELDARRELARDFRIDSLLERPPGPIVYLAHAPEDPPRAGAQSSPRAARAPRAPPCHAAP